MSNHHWVITGGHHNSALVVAEYMLAQKDQVTWFGHRFSTKNDQNDSAEFVEVTAHKIPFVELGAGKLGPGSSIMDMFKVPFGILHAYRKLTHIRPQAVISFGGYLGFATGMAAKLLGIPLFLHEQTTVAGKSNKLLARLATKVYLTYHSSIASLPKGVCSQVVGLPLRPAILAKTRKRAFDNGLPTILVLGGKQGSHGINHHVFRALPSLLSRYNLVHQTGTSSATGDYQKALALLDSLSGNLQSRYRPVGYLVESQLATILDQADLVIGRSGAHITYELAIKGKKSVLIPYLHTHDQEQLKNARLLASQSLAYILPESELSFPKLRHAISVMLRRKHTHPLPLPTDAAALIYHDIVKISKERIC